MEGNVVVSRPHCAPCHTLKEFLRFHAIPYTEKVLGKDITLEELEAILPGVKSVPQVWIGGVHIGGLTEVVEKWKPST